MKDIDKMPFLYKVCIKKTSRGILPRCQWLAGFEFNILNCGCSVEGCVSENYNIQYQSDAIPLYSLCPTLTTWENNKMPFP